MTHSKAKKKRLAKLRAEGKDVTLQRGEVPFSTHERVTKSKQETMDQMFKKYSNELF